MKLISFFLGLIIVLFMAGCSGPKVIVPGVSQKVVAEKATAEGNYAQAVEAWKQYFSVKNMTATLPTFTPALAMKRK
jgi:hypothetical protein